VSFFAHHSLDGIGILLLAAGLWISFRNRDPKRSFESTFGGALISLGVTIIARTAITTNVAIEG